MGYRILTLDLSVARERLEIVARRVPIAFVSVRQLTDDAELNLAFGEDEAIPFDAGDAGRYRCPFYGGIFGTWPAQPGASAKLYVATADGLEDATS